MASHPFQMDDNSDEDFFDKLVDDDYHITKSDYLESNQSILADSTEPELEATSVKNANDELSKLSLDEKEASLRTSDDSGKDSVTIESCLGENGAAKSLVEGCDGKNAFAKGSSFGQKELSFACSSQENVTTGSVDLDSFETGTKPDNPVAAITSLNNANDGDQPATAVLDLKAGESPTKQRDSNVCTNAREVQWSNFDVISARCDLGGFGSYLDFYTDLPGSFPELSAGPCLEKSPAPFPVENDSVLSRPSMFESTSNQTSQVRENGTLDALVADTTKLKMDLVSRAGAFGGPSNDMQNHCNYGKRQEQCTKADQSLAVDGQDVYYNQSWEDAYPGWRYDPVTGVWQQVEGCETMATGSSIGGVGNKECVEGGSQDNSQSTLNDPSYSSWQEQGSQVYYGSGTGSFIEPTSSTNTEVHLLQQTFDSGASLVQAVQGSSEPIVSDWQQYSPNVSGNQQNIIFDPQYPGWYYDLAAQDWRQVADYGQTFQTDGDSTVSALGSQQTLPEQTETGRGVSSHEYSYQDPSLYTQSSQFQGFQTQVTGMQWSGSPNDYGISNGQWQDSTSHLDFHSIGEAIPRAFNNNMTGKNPNDAFTGNQNNVYDPAANIQRQLNQSSDSQILNSTIPSDQFDQHFSEHHKQLSLQNLEFDENVYSYDQLQMDQSQQSEVGHSYYRNLRTVDYSHQTYPVGHPSHAPPVLNSFVEGRSSAGRPPHAMVAFGFGGKLAVVKSNSNVNMESSYGSQDQTTSLITVHRLSNVVMENVDHRHGGIACSYFHTLCRQAFSSPLVGGSVASKEVFKWIDERIANCESKAVDCRNPELLRLLLCSLRIFCQHYGKLRSTFGAAAASQEPDGPEAALTKLFASVKSYGARLNEFGISGQCLQTMPSESQLQASALEMKNLLVAGKRKEALQQAQQGQLWGPALVLAWQLGEKFYIDTVTQMAHRQFLPGTPLRTLFLLLAGQPAEVFSTNNSISSTHVINSYSGTFNGMQQAGQDYVSGMLDDWEENLAIIAANRTKGDERVIVHLGDCLWKERGEVAAAHTCYLVAEANFESFSDSARLCLLGADHWKFPRTYASPEAIQRTELYEYAKVLGNPQFILLPFQPYKLIYANMLAEVGKVSDSLRYCQAVSKTLKNAGRAAEVEACRQLASSLEDRIRIHTQGGYSSNLVPSKLVGRFLTSIDRSIHRIIGAPPPPVVSDSQNNIQNSDTDAYSTVSDVANATHRPGATALMPSASMEPISEWTSGNSRAAIQTRSVSEPDFSRSPKQEKLSFPNSKAESTPSKGHSNAASSGGSSRFGRFGSQILQKAVGFIVKSHHNEAKLGEKNKFYYDENLKRWVEEGAAPSPEEEALSAPPTNAAFVSNSQNMGSAYNTSSALNGHSVHGNGGSQIRSPSSSEHPSGMPPVPPSMNQFSVRGRLHGVRSRYVDTFNKGGVDTPVKSFQSPVIPAAKLGGLPPTANFFVPTTAALDPSIAEAADMTVENISGAACTLTAEDNSDGQSISFQETSTSEERALKVPGSMHRYSSADDVAQFADKGLENGETGRVALFSRSRAASWSGGYPNSFNKAEEPEAFVTPERNQLSKMSDVSGRVSGYFSYPMKLDAQRSRTGGYVYASLPSPPSIGSSHSSMSIKKSLVIESKSKSKNNVFRKMDDGSESSIRADSFGDDLQEVEL